jgi:spore germination cell wall hydrolase CwlJ-like protein
VKLSTLPALAVLALSCVLEMPPAPKKSEVSVTEQTCLAVSLYHEANNEPYEGKIAVGQVHLNRKATGRWGNDICSVVYANKQFSWTHAKKLSKISDTDMQINMGISYKLLSGDYEKSIPDTVLWYHANYVKPIWRNSLDKVKQIGAHIFYKPKE